MLISPPRGFVYLIDTPLSADNEHQIKFANEVAQREYFTSFTPVELEYNYVRHENSMSIPYSYDDAIKYNYCCYQNTQVNNKWYYAFIEKFDFINDEATKIYLKLDVWQTWQFDIALQKSFIERESFVNDEMNSLSDTPSEGNLVTYLTEDHTFTGAYFIFCNSDVTQKDTTTSSQYAFKIGNYCIPSMVLMYNMDEAQYVANTLQSIANNGYGDRINSAVYVPVVGDVSTLDVQDVATYKVCTGSQQPEQLLKTSYSFDFGSIVTDKLKALTFPYCKLIVQDMSTGQSIELEPNKFDSTIATFEMQSTICETPSYRVIPINYKGQAKAYSDSLVVKCNTSLPVANNMYAKYLMNNQDLNSLKLAGATVGMMGSIAAKSPMGAISGFEAVTNVVLQSQQAQRQPNQLSAITDGALERIQFQNGIKIMLVGMDENHKRTANDYWKMFGYPKRYLDYPTCMPSFDFTFTKTQNANITGSIPQDDLREICSMFDRGVTFWKADKFRQY